MQKGGAFLVEEAGSKAIFIPEDLSIEQKELSRTVHDFVVNEVLPKEALIEAQAPGLMPQLLREAAKLGLMAVEVPATYGGLDLGTIEAAAIAEGSTLQASFNVSYMCQTGIATAPLVYYGSDEQKKKYLTRLASGEFIGAFALTEADAGSDAMAIKTKAKLSPDKKNYILNGRKQFITNGGFADLFTVLAKLDDETGVTALLVEKDFKGVSIGKEEKKMGIHGSSTVSIMFDNVEVSVENVLGQIGKGHHIAFNILNLGRLKLGSACVGSCRHLVNVTYNYVKERVQFGKPIISFQMIQEKLAMMAVRTLLLESLVFRSAGEFDEATKEANKAGKIDDALREYPIEASISKVFGSEMLNWVADDALQLHGGYGYCEEYGIERYLRDSRINRIYEGTNEINRLVITGTLLKLIAKGKLDIFKVLGDAKERIKELITKVDRTSDVSKIFAFVEVVKRLILFIGGGAVQKFGNEIQDEEFILAGLADMIIELYAIESTYIRAKQLDAQGKPERARDINSALYFYLLGAVSGILDNGRRVMMRVVPEDAKDFKEYEKVMFGCIDFITGDQQKLALNIINEIDKAGGYAF